MMKCFLAIPIKSTIVNQQLSALKKQYPDFNWVPEQNLHLTLHFFGKIEVTQIRIITALMDQLCQAQQYNYSFTLNKTIYLPSPTKPKVLAYTIEPATAIEELATIIHETLAKHGFPIEARKFLPHVTFARMSSSHDISEQFKLPKIDTLLTAQQIVLYESVSSENGVKYQPVKVFSLLESQ